MGEGNRRVKRMLIAMTSKVVIKNMRHEAWQHAVVAKLHASVGRHAHPFFKAREGKARQGKAIGYGMQDKTIQSKARQRSVQCKVQAYMLYTMAQAQKFVVSLPAQLGRQACLRASQSQILSARSARRSPSKTRRPMSTASTWRTRRPRKLGECCAKVQVLLQALGPLHLHVLQLRRL